MNRATRALPVIIFSLLLSAAACSSGTNDKTDVPAGNDAVTTETTTPPVTSAIGTEGGTVENDDGVKLEIPAGALTEDTEFQVSMTNMSPSTLPSGLTLVSTVVTITPTGTVFDKPVKLTIPWQQDFLPEEDSLESVKLYVAPNMEGPWEQLETTVEEGFVSAEIMHLSDYAAGSGCVQLGGGCGSAYGLHCCKPAECIGEKCEPCVKTDQPCGSVWDCCDGLHCTDGKCIDCAPKGGSCVYGAECCNMAYTGCVDGKCGDCKGEGSPCKSSSVCCMGFVCVEGICNSECGKIGETCGQRSDCCGWQTQHNECNGGVCSACGKKGEDCKDRLCCPALTCDDGACIDCKDLGQSCFSSFDCCNAKCQDNKCVSCFQQAKPCKEPADCCSGKCESNTCGACPVAATKCTSSPDCCPGDCCKEKTLTCFEGECSACVPSGQSCAGFGVDCCGGLKCIDDVCEECHGVEGSCSTDYQCCEPLKCQDNKCFQCVEEGSECGDGKPCCKHKCIQGKCQDCLGHGASCEGNFDCCMDSCVNSKCVECSNLDEQCDADKPCCEMTKCEGGKCVMACAWPSQDCNEEMECCPGGYCAEGKCYECIEKGDECEEDIPCCPGLECNDEEECDEPGGGDGECACETPGTTVKPVSGCDDWPDADQCSGWASVVIESNGWEFTDENHNAALSQMFASGTEVCAFGCCIKITCP